MKEVISFFKQVKTFFAATVDGDAPRVRPFGATMDFEGKMYIGMSNPKKVYQQLQQNPKIELCAYDGTDKWVRVEGAVVFDKRAEAREAMLVDYPDLRNMYSADDGIFEVCYLKDATATFYSFADAPRTVNFG